MNRVAALVFGSACCRGRPYTQKGFVPPWTTCLLGSEYRAHRERTPMFLPRLRGGVKIRPTSQVAA